jgi:Protein of unknown function (DUF2934)
METTREDEVRTRAYAIWEREGRPEGGAERHWGEAEEELRTEERGGARAPAAGAGETPGKAGRGARPARTDATRGGVVAVRRGGPEDGGAVARARPRWGRGA